MVLPDSHRVSRVLQYLGTTSRERSISPTGLSPSLVVLSRSLRLSVSLLTLWPKPEAAPQPLLFCKNRFGLFPVRSPLLGESLLISFPSGTEMFHFPPFASLARCVSITSRGLPIRVSAALHLLNGSPQLFAARHALRRFPTPRHPPHALRSLPFVSPRRATTCLHPLSS